MYFFFTRLSQTLFFCPPVSPPTVCDVDLWLSCLTMLPADLMMMSCESGPLLWPIDRDSSPARQLQAEFLRLQSSLFEFLKTTLLKNIQVKKNVKPWVGSMRGCFYYWLLLLLFKTFRLCLCYYFLFLIFHFLISFTHLNTCSMIHVWHIVHYHP